MTDQEVRDRADRFWLSAGRTELFPRSLESTISWALPVTIVRLPRLYVSDVFQWLGARRVRLECRVADRRLRACLVARAGCGLLFIDGTDFEAERRFSLAHELSHFLLDYLDPRHRALAALGEEIRPVLDGRRPASLVERVDGVLRGVLLGTYTHFMDRTGSGAATQISTRAAEDRADRLALELLAPRHLVLRRLRTLTQSGRGPGLLVVAESLLVEAFGLPGSVATRYARQLEMTLGRPASFREWLRT